MAECSGSRFKPLDKPIEEYITDQAENKNTRAKNAAGCEAFSPAFLLEKNEQRKIEEIQPGELTVACEYNRLLFAPATTCETRTETLSLRVSHVVAGANERRLYSQAKLTATLVNSLLV